MEKELFEWDNWDSDIFAFIFYNCRLKVAIGEYPVGTFFDSARLDFENGKLGFYDVNAVEPMAEFSLKLVVGEKVK